jgi:ribosomal protein S18 acetylase RimI-like enzyme
MGVDPALRGRQIGKVLARRALDSMKSQGLARALIGAAGPIEFYERCCGAVVAERLERPV